MSDYPTDQISTTERETSTPFSEMKRKFIIVIALLSTVIIIQAVKIYLDYSNKKQLTVTVENKEEELQGTITRLENIRQELDEKIEEMKKLGGTVTELEEARADLEAELGKKNKNNEALEAKARGYEQLLRNKDKQIRKLKTINKALFTENTGLKNTKNELSDSILSLSENTAKLIEKVNIASQLQAENIGTFAVNKRGKERKSPFRNRHIKKLKVVFNIVENKVAPIEEKEIMIRIVDENEQIIFDVANGSGTFMHNGKETFYTATQKVLFDNSQQTVTFFYDKGSKYNKGVYMMEVYTSGYKMGNRQFKVK